LDPNFITELPRQSCLNLLEDALERLHLHQNGISIESVDFGELHQSSREEIAIGNLVFDALDFDPLDSPYISWDEKLG
jgi:hypothetical protein